MRSEEISSVVARLYEAVLAPAKWPAALAGIADAMEAHHAITLIQHSNSHRVTFLAAVRVNPDCLANIENAVVAGDLNGFLQSVPSQTALPFSAVLPKTALRHSNFYDDVVRLMNGYHGAVVLPKVSSETAGFFVVCRSRRQDDYDNSEMGRLGSTSLRRWFPCVVVRALIVEAK